MPGGGLTLGTFQKKDPSGAPFSSGAAVNGLSVNGSGQIVWGNDTAAGAAGPAALLSNREISTQGFSMLLRNYGTAGMLTLSGDSMQSQQGGSVGLFQNSTISLFNGASATAIYQNNLNFTNPTGNGRLTTTGNALQITDGTAGTFIAASFDTTSPSGGAIIFNCTPFKLQGTANSVQSIIQLFSGQTVANPAFRIQSSAAVPYLDINSTAANSVFIGVFAGVNDNGANENIGIGYAAYNGTSGARNIAIGYGALGTISTTSDNISIGSTSGSGNLATTATTVMIGVKANQKGTGGSLNVFIGHQAGASSNTAAAHGTNSVVIGANAGFGRAVPNNNVIIGGNSINTDLLGTSNVFIGAGHTTAGATVGSSGLFGTAMSVNQSNTIVIGGDAQSVIIGQSLTTAVSPNKLYVVGGISINNPAFLLSSTTAMTNGAAAAIGTLTNAPVAGNPTKWVAFIDNGTTRYIPMW